MRHESLVHLWVRHPNPKARVLVGEVVYVGHWADFATSKSPKQHNACRLVDVDWICINLHEIDTNWCAKKKITTKVPNLGMISQYLTYKFSGKYLKVRVWGHCPLSSTEPLRRLVFGGVADHRVETWYSLWEWDVSQFNWLLSMA